jgi:hypothetical protein
LKCFHYYICMYSTEDYFGEIVPTSLAFHPFCCNDGS